MTDANDPSADLTGRCALVTGANTGIGLAAAKGLAARGATLILHGRDRAKLDRAVEAVAAVARVPMSRVVADFTDLAEVARLAAEIRSKAPALDVLVNNAGIIRDRMELTRDGYETTFQVNHLAPFLLTNLLLDALDAAPLGRIVNVASGAHGSVKGVPLDDVAAPRRYRTLDAYARAKGCNILFNRELARRLDDRPVATWAVHPGVVASDFGADGDVRGPLRWTLRLFRPAMRTPDHGAATAVWLAATAAPPPSGAYVVDKHETRPRPWARDDRTAARLWELSERLVAPHLAAAGVAPLGSAGRP
jgi:NAD(P)-dependent dehydrogenase (short-subunit alcohol dehydrogenase family)